MKLGRIILMLAAAASLAACKTADVASAAGVALGLVPIATQLTSKGDAAQPASGMTKESYDDSKKLYLSTVKRGAVAFRSGAIPIATSADVQQDNFCELVLLDQARIDDGDIGGELSGIECQAEKELSRLADALGDGDAVGFAKAKGNLAGHLAAMDKIISAAEKEATP